MPELERLDQEARAWVARLKSGEATAEDAALFKTWRGRSDAHREALRRALRLWEITGQAVAVPRRQGLTRRLVLGGGIAASAVAAQQAAVFLGLAPGLQALMADHATLVGEVAPFDLATARGSLDGGSALDVTSNAELRLIEGAVFVETRGSDPVRAQAAGLDLQVRSGALELYLGATGAEVTCAVGEVSIRTPTQMTLGPGEVLRVTRGGTLQKGRRADDEIAPWRRGLLSFRNRALADVLSDLNRHRRGRVMLGRAPLGQRQVSGVFHLDRPEQIVSHLVTTLELSRRDLPGGIVLLS